ncbi:hypothetical protein FRX31_032111 [Thalictrum thalictroides]|uniref:Uncharacterized protein n=1 Tax=Thalictrum thalictroides TaxID=46969 RepID=A0A7J6V0M9_THATH|nr:hypothetical protein FRX31_032111 [Thalictrum thalictroides]
MVIHAFRLKLCWRLITTDSLWATFMRQKYIRGRPLKSIPLSTRASKSWKDCWRCLNELVDLSTWDFGPGNFSLGKENWGGMSISKHGS